MIMDIQRLRNLTTGKLHTNMEHIYQDFEFITGSEGIMTHMLPNMQRAVEPWLKAKITDERFWDNKFDITHVGSVQLLPMTKEESAECFKRYAALPHPFNQLGEKTNVN